MQRGYEMKKFFILLSVMICSASIFAYNPPLGGENVLRLTNPDLIGGAASASGGALYAITPSSIVFNPALTAREERVDFCLDGTVFFNTNKVELNGVEDKTAGGAFDLGVIFPTRFCVFSGIMQGVFAHFNTMNLRNSLVFHFNISKDVVADKLSVGMNLYSGFYMGEGSDFSIGADLGFLYTFGDLGFLRNSRLGFAFLNLGKPVNGESYKTNGIKSGAASSDYPAFLTPRFSFAGDLFHAYKFSGGFYTDLSFPTFQNVVFDLGFGFNWSKCISLNTCWQVNMREVMENGKTGLLWPSVNLSFKFDFNSSKISMKNADWEKSEIVPSIAWQNLYNGIQAISFGANMYMGMADVTAPEIFLWDEE